MTKDIIVSRQCSVGPDGLFMPGPNQGAVTISVNFFRPAPYPEQGQDIYPAYRCDYEIKYGDEVIHASDSVGVDGVAALLSAMVHAASNFEYRHFNSRPVDIPKEYLDAIPMRYFDDMRKAWGQSDS